MNDILTFHSTKNRQWKYQISNKNYHSYKQLLSWCSVGSGDEAVHHFLFQHSGGPNRHSTGSKQELGYWESMKTVVCGLKKTNNLAWHHTLMSQPKHCIFLLLLFSFFRTPKMFLWSCNYWILAHHQHCVHLAIQNILKENGDCFITTADSASLFNYMYQQSNCL